jgi:hypothetical protein
VTKDSDTINHDDEEEFLSDLAVKLVNAYT